MKGEGKIVGVGVKALDTGLEQTLGVLFKNSALLLDERQDLVDSFSIGESVSFLVDPLSSFSDQLEASFAGFNNTFDGHLGGGCFGDLQVLHDCNVFGLSCLHRSQVHDCWLEGGYLACDELLEGDKRCETLVSLSAAGDSHEE